MNKSIAQIKLELHKATGGALPIGPPADVAAKLAALKEQMRQQGTNFDRRMQGVVNAEKTAGTGVVLPTDKASGGVAHMAGGGHKELEEYIRQHEGQYGLHRLQRAQDEIHNLHGMYAPEALRQAFSGDNAKALMTMNPADFEKYAMQLKGNQTTGAITPSLEDRIKGQKARKTDLSTEDYVKYLQSIGKFSDVPYLQIDKEEVGLPLTPFISGHEGRHRNRAMASQGINRGLVVLHPRTELREPLPRRSREEYINALKEELAMTGNMVKPQQDKTNPRPAIQMPDIYADGGEVDQGDPLSNLPPISPQQTTAMDKYRLALWAEKNNPDMLTANNNELAALLMRNRKGQTYDDRSEEGATWRKSQANPSVSPSDLQNMPGDNTFGQRREMPRPESFDYPRLEKGDDYRRPEQEARQKRDEIARKAMELGFPFTGTYYAHGGVTHAHHLEIEERPL